MKKRMELLKIKFLPKELDEGILYVSKKFGVAGHLCPCGCGNKVITPLDSFEWKLKVKKGKPSLFPSIGNWQLDCKSHYWIINGQIEWSEQWSEKEIVEGNKREEIYRNMYFEERDKKRKIWSILRKILKQIF